MEAPGCGSQCVPAGIDAVTTRLSLIPDFRRLWFVGLVSSVVRWLEMLVMALFAYQTTGSAFVVAMLSMLRLLPMGLFGAFLGAAADRFEHRSALIALVAMSMLGTVPLAILASLDALQIWHLAVASFINGICWAADNPVRRVMIGEVVGPDRMGAAMSFDAATNNASRVLGPILGGMLLAQYGIAAALWLGVALYGAGLAAAFKLEMHARGAGARHASFFSSIREGLAWVRGDPRMIGVFAMTVIFNLFGWPFTSMIPVISTDHLQLGPQGVGLLASAEGVGGLLGALLIAALTRQDWYGRIYIGAVAAYLAMVIGFAVAPLISMAAVCLFFAGFANAGFAIMQVTLLYRLVPAEMRARLFGVLSVCIGTGPIGFLYLGFLADVLTPRVAVVALAAHGVVALMLTRRYWITVFRP
jgi:MFS family permease